MLDRTLSPFHLAIPVNDLAQARAFYGGVLGCAEGRSAARWVDFNLFGHQLVCHWVPPRAETPAVRGHNPVDGESVPVPHFGVVMNLPDWDDLQQRLRRQGVRFLIEPSVRFKGEPGEQATLFLLDPSGNALEFKAFADIEGQLFAR
ncbi:MAG: VOC family protein [Candidatus Thiodiazotropha sp.]